MYNMTTTPEDMVFYQLIFYLLLVESLNRKLIKYKYFVNMTLGTQK